MLRLTSLQQALSLRGNIPELAVIRSMQFQGEGYCPIEHGHIIVFEEGDDVDDITEIYPGGFIDDDGLPTFEFIEMHEKNGHKAYEVVFQIDDSMTIAVIIPDEPWLDGQLKAMLQLFTATSLPSLQL